MRVPNYEGHDSTSISIQLDGVAKKLGAKLLGFGVEAYGAVGKVLKKYHEFAATSIAAPSLWCLKSYASQALAITTQAGNAHGIRQGAIMSGARTLNCFLPLALA